jgi:hypothetical protein
MWPDTKPKKFIIWGHEHYTHTHSYIHYGYFKAAESLGWDVQWLKNTKENALNLGNTDEYVFFTESSVDSFIPINSKAFYILHNCDMNKYSEISLKNKLVIQVFTKDVYSRNIKQVKNNLFEFWQEDNNTLYMPWATDILPNEINENINNLKIQKNNKALFIGSYWGGQYGNNNEIDLFKIGCQKNNIEFNVLSQIEQTQSIKLIQNVFVAPTIVGKWQKNQGYIPCRIFKNVSYGQLGITNSKEAYEVINKLGVYNSNESELIKDALEKNNDIELRKQAMEFVRDNHTYLNRISSLEYIFKVKQTS